MTTKAIPRKDSQLGVRVTAEQKRDLTRLATARGMRLSEFVRHIVLRVLFENRPTV